MSFGDGPIAFFVNVEIKLSGPLLIHVLIHLQLTDENKRKVLGDVLYQIRFPTMDLNDFCKTVGSSRVLTSEEAFDVVLRMKESTPRNKLTFLDTPRIITWQELFYTNAQYGYEQCLHSCQQSVNISQGHLKVSSVYFIDIYGMQTDRVHLSKYGNVRTLQNRLHQGQQLYEAVFDPPVRLNPGDNTITFSKSDGGYFNAIQVTGQNTLQYKDVTVTMPGNPWYFVVGFKFRKC